MLLQQVTNGLMLGSIYMLVAVAFTMSIGILNFLNFATPGLFMIGGMLSWAIIVGGWHWSIAVAGALLAAAIVSIIIERLLYRRMRGGDPEVPLVGSLGFLVLLENLVLIRYGSDQQTFPTLITNLNFRFEGLVVGKAQALSLLISFAVVIALTIVLRRTSAGRHIRAIAESADTAVVLGINVNRIVSLVFVCSGIFAALAGVLFAVNYSQVSPFMGESVAFKGIAAMIVGGMGSVWGAIIGGLVIGLTEVLSIYFLGSDFVNIMVYGVLLLLLIVRPTGLLGRSVAREKL